jgi:uncharacterized metal-binding protein
MKSTKETKKSCRLLRALFGKKGKSRSSNMTEDIRTFTCADCSVRNCYRKHALYPAFCLTERTDPSLLAECTESYRGESLDARMARSAAEVEGAFYGKLTRVEEIMAFARRIGAVKIGVATCIGLMEESKVFVKVLEANTFEPFMVVCKVGSVDKGEIGIPEALKVKKDCYEAICNPILQARLLNHEPTDLNVMVGLCVGHDSLFMRHSEAPVTTLITKDRVLGHNPAAALYTSGSYYRRLLQKGKEL